MSQNGYGDYGAAAQTLVRRKNDLSYLKANKTFSSGRAATVRSFAKLFWPRSDGALLRENFSAAQRLYATLRTVVGRAPIARWDSFLPRRDSTLFC